MENGTRVISRTTQAAEGMPRWRWTTAELIRLTELGAFKDTDRFELIGGEIVPMSPVGRRHRIIAEAIVKAWRNAIGDDVMMLPEQQLDLDEATYTQPGLLLWPSATLIPDVRGPDVLLLIEVSKTTLKRDMVFKAPLYAHFGVREYWVIDGNSLKTFVHTRPSGEGYGSRVEVDPTGELRPSLLPRLRLRMADIGGL
jgi:Uma2 family endonuclease